jgi:hypothetical protein
MQPTQPLHPIPAVVEASMSIAQSFLRSFVLDRLK